MIMILVVVSTDEGSICTVELLAIEAAIEYFWESSDEEFMAFIAGS